MSPCVSHPTQGIHFPSTIVSPPLKKYCAQYNAILNSNETQDQYGFYVGVAHINSLLCADVRMCVKTFSLHKMPPHSSLMGDLVVFFIARR